MGRPSEGRTDFVVAAAVRRHVLRRTTLRWATRAALAMVALVLAFVAGMRAERSQGERHDPLVQMTCPPAAHAELPLPRELPPDVPVRLASAASSDRVSAPRAEGGGLGRLHVVVRPWAMVAVDDVHIGETPMKELRLPSGEHTLSITNPDLRLRETMRVQIKAATTTEVDYDFFLHERRLRVQEPFELESVQR